MGEATGEAQGAEMDAASEVVAAQFAGGMAVAQLAEEWERDQEWVEAAIRRAMLEYIPARSGGLKRSRTELQAARRELEAGLGDLQPSLPLPSVGPLAGTLTNGSPRRVLGYAENGYRVGESHHNVRISDEVVDRIREMHEEGKTPLREIADQLGLSLNTVAAICCYRRRATRAVRFKRVTE